MKKIVLTFLAFSLFALSSVVMTNAETTSAYATKTKVKKDVIKNKEYAQIKRAYFDAEGYGDVYNCQVEKQKFCKVKNLESGFYTLCDRDVTRTQMESARVQFVLGRCTKLN